ncbi:MAG: tryptophan--tRNA ligase [Gammaproteobacteria bacterium]|nr:tryptophan--tRNA ligase [Gammaproteobacteria bacterium]
MNSLHRIVSGMRPTGYLHLGHYHGVLKNWVKLQETHRCFFFVADLHALTTHYQESHTIANYMESMLVDWLSVGIDPKKSVVFIQSAVPEHAELHALLSMITPLSWLERVPTYKDYIRDLKGKEGATYGFLGYPLLQSADVLIYKAAGVPVGEDQLPHLEVARELARRFNFLFGLNPEFLKHVQGLISHMEPVTAKRYERYRKAYLEKGDGQARQDGKDLVMGLSSLTEGDKECLLGYCEGTGKTILPEPEPILNPAGNLLGIDGRKMSKSYHNTIGLREEPRVVTQKIRTMPTDPARARRENPGNPEKCPVWPLHRVFSSDETQKWVMKGCTTAGIGCLECKQPVIDHMLKEIEPIRERAKEWEAKPNLVHRIVEEGNEVARAEAQKTLKEVKQAMGLFSHF